MNKDDAVRVIVFTEKEDSSQLVQILKNLLIYTGEEFAELADNGQTYLNDWKPFEASHRSNSWSSPWWWA